MENVLLDRIDNLEKRVAKLQADCAFSVILSNSISTTVQLYLIQALQLPPEEVAETFQDLISEALSDACGSLADQNPALAADIRKQMIDHGMI